MNAIESLKEVNLSTGDNIDPKVSLVCLFFQFIMGHDFQRFHYHAIYVQDCNRKIIDTAGD